MTKIRVPRRHFKIKVQLCLINGSTQPRTVGSRRHRRLQKFKARWWNDNKALLQRFTVQPKMTARSRRKWRKRSNSTWKSKTCFTMTRSTSTFTRCVRRSWSGTWMCTCPRLVRVSNRSILICKNLSLWSRKASLLNAITLTTQAHSKKGKSISRPTSRNCSS